MKMPLKYLVGWSIIVGSLLAFAGYAWLGPLLIPERMPWEAKNAHAKCIEAIAGSLPWPSEPKAACRAMTMCANEATLNPRQSVSLLSAMRKLPECAEL
ncbi:hypothetical protein [Microvirga guangxiensis]|uniref:Uncharacterized protein n=1 Tax=Microvirga guangxiensis TaxID=549386 RepID=A0A1G5IVJ7_9HYPH|nr:hypothetical protein [Microvirga guangxiensis]SCY80102.1 hypothetical protein SAMN02927923_02342 [Microvirga guangxiensis]